MWLSNIWKRVICNVREEGRVVAHPRQLALEVKEGQSHSMLCCSRKSAVFDANGLEEKTIDEPTKWVDLKNALVTEKNRLDHLLVNRRGYD
jgi:hypothetical protein